MTVGVLGYGTAGRLHVRGYAANPDVSRVVVYDPKAITVDESNVSVVHDLDRFWNEMPTLVSICTPTVTHLEYVAEALSRHVHVLCEKPLALISDDIAPWIDVARQEHLQFGAAFGHRFFAPTMKLLRLLEEGVLGVPTFLWNRFAVNYRSSALSWKWNPAMSGGGAAIDTLIHSVDLFRFLFGDPTQMTLYTAQALPEWFGSVEDNAVALIHGTGPFHAVLQADWSTPVKEYSLRVFGTKGQARVLFETPRLEWETLGGVVQHEDFPGSALDRFTAMTMHFVNACLGREVLRSSAQDGWQAMRLLEQACHKK